MLVTKPATQKLSHHIELIEAAKKNNVVCFVEHHKRYAMRKKPREVMLRTDFAPYSFDPVYSDAKARAAVLGEFNFFNAWMSQPKSQLETFKAWAGKDSDIRCATLNAVLLGPLALRFCLLAITCPLTTSTSAAGYCRTKPSRLEWSQAQRPGLRLASHTTVWKTQKIRSLCSWTGSRSRVLDTRELLSTLRHGPHRSKPACTRPSTGITWGKRSDKRT